jgi:hypothetical protein
LPAARPATSAQQIVVEGVRLIDDALRSGVTPVTLFYDPALTAPIRPPPRWSIGLQRLAASVWPAPARSSPHWRRR